MTRAVVLIALFFSPLTAVVIFASTAAMFDVITHL